MVQRGHKEGEGPWADENTMARWHERGAMSGCQRGGRGHDKGGHGTGEAGATVRQGRVRGHEHEGEKGAMRHVKGAPTYGKGWGTHCRFLQRRVRQSTDGQWSE
ncbi:hypothetical protein DENSPDRAFT_848405 [Dentipellis sp. KUC8613]|nr:hypothetical protein DENSPDRAFT_848405 [Dentipellis sp. KUC8613]